MSDWVMDIAEMHMKFGVNDWQYDHADDKELMQKYIKFRMDMIQEEVDGLIDMCVFAIGTLNVFGMDSQKAWDAVHNANMAKVPGVKESRPNPFGMPDLIKPEGWEGPSHEGNHGDLPNII